MVRAVEVAEGERTPHRSANDTLFLTDPYR